jgi:hypothetical protein
MINRYYLESTLRVVALPAMLAACGTESGSIKVDAKAGFVSTGGVSSAGRSGAGGDGGTNESNGGTPDGTESGGGGTTSNNVGGGDAGGKTGGNGGSGGKATVNKGGNGGIANSGGAGATGRAGASNAGSGGNIGGAAGAPPNPCTMDGGCQPGVWVDVTPAPIVLTDLPCGNAGVKSVQADPLHAQNMYAAFHCQGVWKSSNYGQTFEGPINTGTNGDKVTNCAGSITLAPTNAQSEPILYLSCIRGNVGFWVSEDGGVNWTNYVVGPAPNDATGQQFYPPVVDPYNNQHLLMVGHGNNLFIESTDGGKTWSTVNTDPGMAMSGGTGGPWFVDNGDPGVTHDTWLWMASASGGGIGTWRTKDGGTSWTHVETCEHVNGGWQLYQPDKNGSIFMAGVYSSLGWGVLHSKDFGNTWEHVGGPAQESVVFGTSKALYAAYGAGIPGDPSLEVTPQPGTGDWTNPGTPAEMTQGPAEAAVTNDGKNSIVVLANYTGGLWRYVEP